MGFFKKLFDSQKERLPNEELKKTSKSSIKSKKDKKNIFIEIGKMDSCPYCNRKLKVIPKAKKKCPYCEKYIFVRTRPLDRKKVLIREDQKEDLEKEWEKYHAQKEEESLTEDSQYMEAKKELKKQFGKEPSVNDVKWRKIGKEEIEHVKKRQWGLYRNNQLDKVNILSKEGKHLQALESLLFICYLDINGPNNVGIISRKEMDEYGIKEFNPKMAFLAPGIISMINDLVDQLKITETELKKLFINTNEKMKPMKNMPVSLEYAWKKLSQKIKNDKKINLSKKKIGHHEKAIELSQKSKVPLRELRLATRKDLLRLKKEGVKKVRWIASAGPRTCKKCASLNGKIYSIEEVLKNMPLPLRDCKNLEDGCRCCWVSVVNIQ